VSDGCPDSQALGRGSGPQRRRSISIVTENRSITGAFSFLDAVVSSDMHFDTAGSLWGCRRVWGARPAARVRRAWRRSLGDVVYVANGQRMASHCLLRLGGMNIRSSLSRDRRAIRLWQLLGSVQRAISGRLDLLLRALSAPSRGLTA
jgi:hypothetical protein